MIFVNESKLNDDSLKHIPRNKTKKKKMKRQKTQRSFQTNTIHLRFKQTANQKKKKRI